MKFLTFLIVGLVISGLDILMFKEKSTKNKIINSFGYTIGINTLALFTMRYILGKCMF